MSLSAVITLIIVFGNYFAAQLRGNSFFEDLLHVMDAAEHRCLPLCGDESGKERICIKKKRIVTLPYLIVDSTHLYTDTEHDGHSKWWFCC